MKNKVYFLVFTTLCTFTSIIAQVGIGTTNPQAQLEVAGGNVRFSDYGTGNHTGALTNLLGVEADGDVIETPLTAGLSFYSWDGLATTAGTQNGPDIIDTNQIYEFMDEGMPALGSPDRSGLFTGELDIRDDPSLDPIRPNGANDGILVVFKGIIVVRNGGSFTFNSNSDDGTRVYVDQTLVLNDWRDQGATTPNSGTVNLAPGRHQIAFWWYEETGGHVLNFTWGANPDGYTGPIQATQFFIE